MTTTTTTFHGRIWTVGQQVRCNGYDGAVTRLFDGDMSCMAEVRVPGGTTCVGLSDLARDNPLPRPDALTYEDDGDGLWLNAEDWSACAAIDQIMSASDDPENDTEELAEARLARARTTLACAAAGPDLLALVQEVAVPGGIGQHDFLRPGGWLERALAVIATATKPQA